jgi:hypothetical protein
MRLFEVSQAAVDRWHRENPHFPREHKFGNPYKDNCSTRFVVSEVNDHIAAIEGQLADWTREFSMVEPKKA